jgi:polysaccharide deacetylase 2 family uncharacterized protein YibQ
MARGFLGGVILGGVFSVGTAGVISVVMPPPLPPQVSDDVSTVAAPERPTQANSGEAASDSDSALATAPASPQTPAPDPDTLAALDAATLKPAAQPVTGNADNLPAPSETDESAAVVLEGDEPVLPNPLALAPMAPEVADELSISTEPAQPPQPQTDSVSGAFENPAQPEVSVDEEVALATAPATMEAPSTVDGTAAAPSAPDLPKPDESAGEDTQSAQIGAEKVDELVSPEPATAQIDVVPDESPALDQVVATDENATPDQLAETETEVVQETPVAPAAEDAVSETQPSEEGDVTAVVTPQTPEPEANPDVQENTQTAALTVAPSIGTPSVNLLDRDSGVSIRRPTNTNAATEGAATPAPVDDPALRPLERFAQAFQPDGDKPLMSIVLIDDGKSPTNGAAGIAALRSFPYALSFAVDTSLPDATARTALLRKEGFEVMAMVDLPEGAQPTDVETAFAATFSQFPEVIGILEGPQASQQSSREVSDQAAAYLSQSGHGWVTQAKGLNTAATLARKEGVPAKAIFRDFDSKGQSAVVIRRFLDQAAFKAGQEGGVIMLGRLRPETISALLLWGLQDRAGQVSLAPVSAVLLAQDP